jgi:hypothetical protein
MFPLTEHDVQFVIAENTLGSTRPHQLGHESNHGRTVGSTVDEVADEDQTTTGSVSSIRCVAETFE